MSMNLYFYSKIHNIDIGFPIQTPTNLSYKVLQAKTNKEKLDILTEWIDETYEDSGYKNYLVRQIKEKLEDKDLELCVG